MTGDEVMASLDEERVWRALNEVMDPEIPVVSVVELGVVREVEITDEGARVTMTPTFSGCPALDVMRQDVKAQLQSLGLSAIEIRWELDPPWTSDVLSEATRHKLREFGLAPAPKHEGNVQLVLEEPRACPRCGSRDTTLKNSFGSTLCRSLHYCNECQEPFHALKPL